MNKREILIEKYANDLREKCGEIPDMELLRKVTIGCGPAIYNRDSATISLSEYTELETVKRNFIKKKLNFSDDIQADSVINAVMDKYGHSTKAKYRAVVYYLIVKALNKEAIYK